MTTEPIAFETIEDLESWLSRNHDTESELIVRLYKVQSGIPSITWDELVQGILCWGWIDGIKMSNRAALVEAGHDLDQIAERLVLAFLTQAISHGYFHADMHQGNLFALPGNRVAAIDFGIMGRIDPYTRHANGSLAFFYPPRRKAGAKGADFTVTPSLRLEAFRESVDDFEYASMLEELVKTGRKKSIEMKSAERAPRWLTASPPSR